MTVQNILLCISVAYPCSKCCLAEISYKVFVLLICILIAKLTDENGQQYDDHHNDSNEDNAQDYESKFE